MGPVVGDSPSLKPLSPLQFESAQPETLLLAGAKLAKSPATAADRFHGKGGPRCTPSTSIDATNWHVSALATPATEGL